MSKTAPKPEAAAAAAVVAPPAGAKKKKMLIMIIIAALVLAGGGGAAFVFLGQKDSGKKEGKKSAEKSAPPVFLALENFVVNLQSENNDKYLQAGITLQVKNEEQVNYYKANMPQLRSRILLLLSGKDSTELLTQEGKNKLANEITHQAELPYNKDEVSAKDAEERKISGVFFTSFMIQ